MGYQVLDRDRLAAVALNCGRNCFTGSVSSSCRRSRNNMTAETVIGFVSDAIRKGVSIFAGPYARANSKLP